MKKTIYITLGITGAALAASFAFNYFFRAMGSAEVIRKLQGMRLAVELFRQAAGHLPADINEVVRNGSLEAVPELKLKRHFASSKVRNADRHRILDTGSWGYVNDPGSADFGKVFIDCSHQDEKGRYWSEF
jgi:hypothetical protein